MDTRPMHLRWHGTLLAGLIALSGGCYHTQDMVIPPPPDGAVPTEMNKVVLPRYVIEAPDVLLVEVLLPPEQHLKLPRGAAEKEPQPKPADAQAKPPATPTPPTPDDALNYYSAPLTPSPIGGN